MSLDYTKGGGKYQKLYNTLPKKLQQQYYLAKRVDPVKGKMGEMLDASQRADVHVKFLKVAMKMYRANKAKGGPLVLLPQDVYKKNKYMLDLIHLVVIQFVTYVKANNPSSEFPRKYITSYLDRARSSRKEPMKRLENGDEAFMDAVLLFTERASKNMQKWLESHETVNGKAHAQARKNYKVRLTGMWARKAETNNDDSNGESRENRKRREKMQRRVKKKASLAKRRATMQKKKNAAARGEAPPPPKRRAAPKK